jgi:hypothetical protein
MRVNPGRQYRRRKPWWVPQDNLTFTWLTPMEQTNLKPCNTFFSVHVAEKQQNIFLFDI